MERPIRNSSSLILLLLLTFSTAELHATTLHSWWYNREGVAKLKDKSFLGAYRAFMKALEDDPLNAEVQLNLGLAFEANEEYDKAEQAYKGALNLIPENSSRRFEALFNLAGVYAKQKNIEMALSTYQACLEIDPDSKEVKTNIELLWKGGGGGGGKGKPDKSDKEGKDKQPQSEGQQDQQQPEKKDKQPKPFDSQDLTPQDVKKILDEIKNQEQSIRAHEYERNSKDMPRGKDW